MQTVKTPKHLGGHLGVTHTDAGAIAFLQKQFDARSVLDVGCGPGGMQDVCEQIGLSWIGVDGDPACDREGVILHDFTEGPLHTHPMDLVWSVEFVEHVRKEFLPNVLSAFNLATKAVCMTHALPGKGGHHHVNCQESKYWIDALASVGFTFDPDTTHRIREASTMRREFVRNTSLVFIKT
jgi:cyclopropane fatty-acyl-phospholipid synthase-like methyltransferase